MSNPKGHILKFYKKISALSFLVPNNKFNFTIFMNFDGICVENIYKYEEFSDVKKFKEDDAFLRAHCEIQKLNVYYLNSEHTNIFSHGEGSELSPLIAVTLIDKASYNYMERDELVEELNKISEEENGKTGCEYKYELLGTFSSESYVLVSRSNSYDTIFNVLENLREIEDFPTNTIYTIVGFDPLSKKIRDWNDNDLELSIRLQLSSAAKFKNVSDKIGDFVDVKKQYLTFGKFDLGVVGKATNTESLIKLYGDKGFLDLKDSESGVLSSNTRFLKRLEKNSAQKNKVITKYSDITTKKPWDSKFYGDGRGADNELKRLIIRLTQAQNSVFSQKQAKKTVEEIRDFALKALQNNVEPKPNKEDILRIIKHFNTLLDNRFTYNFRDFESPQADVRCAYSSSKILVAYENCLKVFLKGANYSVYSNLTVATYMEVTAHKAAFYNNLYVFVGFPVDFIYYPNYALPLLVHEMGHQILEHKLTRIYKKEYDSVMSNVLNLLEDKESNMAYPEQIFSECIADIFMVRALDITDYKNYLDVVVWYYYQVDDSLIKEKEFSVVRILAISIFLNIKKLIKGKETDLKSHELFELYKNDIKKEIESYKLYIENKKNIEGKEELLKELLGYMLNCFEITKTKEDSNYREIASLIYKFLYDVWKKDESILTFNNAGIKTLQNKYTSTKHNKFDGLTQFVEFYTFDTSIACVELNDKKYSLRQDDKPTEIELDSFDIKKIKVFTVEKEAELDVKVALYCKIENRVPVPCDDFDIKITVKQNGREDNQTTKTIKIVLNEEKTD
ncbi:MAG: hypothetical protein FWH05_01385 [Oscillospiraceae bacterium]|nr:hypothetical protein [Oscillospiraceae bacterium]